MPRRLRASRVSTRERDLAPPNPPRVALLSETFPGQPQRDAAISHALLRRVAAGELPESLRLYVPDEAVLFSLLDARNPGFARARAVAADLGCPSVLRLAGGHAALFHRRCLAFAWAIPAAQAGDGIAGRFETLANLVVRALARLGVDARQGAVPGEYCPGEYSVNAGGRIKLMGVGQRIIRGGAHVGGVIVVGDSPRLKEILAPVYQALDLPWDPDSAGAVEDVAPGVGVEDVKRALLAEFAAERGLERVAMEDATLSLAHTLEAWHVPGEGPRRAAMRTAPSSEKALDAVDLELG